MKNKKFYAIIAFIFIAFLSASSFKPSHNGPLGNIKVMIITDFGVIKIKLYNETPLHRDNFVKLIREHYYDSLAFHRIIQNFVIEGGDPDSRNAAPSVKLGNGGPGYTIPAEINHKLFHKKGALKFPATRIDKVKLFNEIIHRPENKNLFEKYEAFSRSEQLDSLQEVNAIILKQVELELPKIKPYTFSAEQIKAYTTIGGAPHLDEGYTVFGEVYEGLSIIDEIAKQPVDKNGRPLKDIRIQLSIIQ